MGREIAPKKKITKRTVAELRCPEGKDRAILYDAELTGFWCIAFPTGRKSYVVYTKRSGRHTIGDAAKLTPEQARTTAKQLLGQIAAGANPADARRKARAVRTFKAVADAFVELHVRAKRSPATADEYRRILDRNILPTLGRFRVTDLRRVDVARLHADLAGTSRLANIVLAIISSAWTYAAKRDEVAVADNPAKGIERFPERKKERFLSPDELGRLGEALRAGETVGLPRKDGKRTKLDPFAVAAVRLLLLTGARLSEVLGAKWDDVDLRHGVLWLDKHKTARQTGRKPIYLSAAAQVVLAGLPRIEGKPFICPGTLVGAPRHDLKKPWAALCTAANLPGLRIHDLRHSFASFGAGGGLGLPVIGKLLGHTQASTTHWYAHLDADPLRRAVDSIGAAISAHLDGAGQGGEVVRLPDRRSTP